MPEMRKESAKERSRKERQAKKNKLLCSLDFFKGKISQNLYNFPQYMNI